MGNEVISNFDNDPPDGADGVGVKRALVQNLGNGRFGKQITRPGDGKRVWVRGTSEREVIARWSALAEKWRDLKAGQVTQAKAIARTEEILRGPLSFREALDAYVLTLSGKWKSQVLSIWAHQLAPRFESKLVVDATDAELLAWSTWMAGAYKPKTIGLAWQVLRRMVLLQIPRRIEAVPWTGFRPPRDPVPKHEKREAARSVDEIAALVAAAQARDAPILARGRYADLATRVVVMFGIGLRQGELSGLGWDDLTLEDEPLGSPPSVILRYQAEDGWRRDHPDWTRPLDDLKGREQARIALHPTTAEALRRHRDYLRARGWYRPDGPVFPAGQHAHAGDWRSHADSIRPDTIRELVRDAGLPNPERWVTHSIRGSFITLEACAAAMAGGDGDLTGVMARARHKQLSTTQGYLRAAGRGLVASKLRLTAGEHRALLPPEVAPSLLLPAEAGATLSAPDVTTARVRAALPPKKPRKPRQAAVVSFVEVWAGFVEAVGGLGAAHAAIAAGRPKRPPGITDAAERARVRALHAAEGRGDEPRKARRAGKAAFRAVLARWKAFYRSLQSTGEQRRGQSPTQRRILARAHDEGGVTRLDGMAEHAAARALERRGIGRIDDMVHATLFRTSPQGFSEVSEGISKQIEGSPEADA